MLRDIEVHEAIRMDNLAYLMSTRFEKPLTDLLHEDTPRMLIANAMPIQVAAFYGSTNCFFFLATKQQYSYVDSNNAQVIHFAAAGGNVKILDYILADRTKLTIADGYGNTPLHYAAKFGRTSAVDYLLRLGALTDVSNGEYFTPGHMAAAAGYNDIITLLIKYGDTLQTTNSAGWIPLHYALKFDHREVAETIVQNKCFNMGSEKCFISLLQLAAAKKMDSIINSLLDAGMSALNQNHNGWSLIHWAASVGAADIIQAVYTSQGAQCLMLLDRQERSPAHLAAINDATESYDLLNKICPQMLSHRDKLGMTPFMYACQLGRANIISHFASMTDLTIKDKLGMTPLHHCVMTDRIDLIQAVLDAGANIDEVDNQGQTALCIAIKCASDEVVNFLLSKGASTKPASDGKPLTVHAVTNFDLSKLTILLNKAKIPSTATDHLGRNIAHYAAQVGAKQIIEYLANHYRNLLSSQSATGQTPMFSAVFWNRPEVVQILLDTGTDSANVPDASGDTPLHIASRYNRVEIVRALLMKEDLELNKQNGSGQTPLLVAVESWSEDVVSELVPRFECRVNTADANGMTALLLACKLGQARTVALLVSQPRVRTDVVSKEGLGAAHYATMPACKDTLLVLKESGRIDLTKEAHGIKPSAVLEEAMGAGIEDYSDAENDRNQDEEEEEEEEEEYEDESEALKNFGFPSQVQAPREEEEQEQETPLLLSGGEVFMRRTNDTFDLSGLRKLEEEQKLQTNKPMLMTISEDAE